MNLWLENVAKFEIGHYLENLLESFPDKKIKVLDIGAGTGGDWILLIEKYSNLELHLPLEPQQIVLRPQLITRKSCGCMDKAHDTSLKEYA